MCRVRPAYATCPLVAHCVLHDRLSSTLVQLVETRLSRVMKMMHQQMQSAAGDSESTIKSDAFKEIGKC